VSTPTSTPQGTLDDSNDGSGCFEFPSPRHAPHAPPRARDILTLSPRRCWPVCARDPKPPGTHAPARQGAHLPAHGGQKPPGSHAPARQGAHLPAHGGQKPPGTHAPARQGAHLPAHGGQKPPGTPAVSSALVPLPLPALLLPQPSERSQEAQHRFIRWTIGADRQVGETVTIASRGAERGGGERRGVRATGVVRGGAWWWGSAWGPAGERRVQRESLGAVRIVVAGGSRCSDYAALGDIEDLDERVIRTT
jgi:hypothetical protein